jgi:hypothetical protein
MEAEKARKHSVNKSIRNRPHRVKFIVSSKAHMYLKLHRGAYSVGNVVVSSEEYFLMSAKRGNYLQTREKFRVKNSIQDIKS